MKKIFVLSAIIFYFFIFTATVNAEKGLWKYLDWWDKTNLQTSFDPELLETTNWEDWKGQIQAWIAKIIEQLLKAIWLLAFWFMIYAWFMMIISQGSDEEVENWKRQIQWSIIALLLVFLIEPMVTGVFYWEWSWAGEIIFWPWTEIQTGQIAISGQKWLAELMWFIKYIQMFVAIIALTMLIISALKTFFAQDKEDAFDEQKKSITWIIIWILTISFSQIMIYFWIYNPETWDIWGDKGRIFSEVSWFISYILWFVAAIAVASIIYWWFLMVTSGWDDEKSWKWKSIVLNIIIWSVIIFISYSLVSLIINSF